MAGKRGARISAAGRDRCGEVGPNPERRSRAGADSHRSKLYVRNAAPVEIEHAPPVRRKAVSLPKLTCLKRKIIGGELV